MTNSAKKIIIDACLSIIRAPKRKTEVSSTVVACGHCGRSGITLRKDSDGYICLHCYLEQRKLAKEEVFYEPARYEI